MRGVGEGRGDARGVGMRVPAGGIERRVYGDGDGDGARRQAGDARGVGVAGDARGAQEWPGTRLARDLGTWRTAASNGGGERRRPTAARIVGAVGILGT